MTLFRHDLLLLLCDCVEITQLEVRCCHVQIVTAFTLTDTAMSRYSQMLTSAACQLSKDVKYLLLHVKCYQIPCPPLHASPLTYCQITVATIKPLESWLKTVNNCQTPRKNSRHSQNLQGESS